MSEKVIEMKLAENSKMLEDRPIQNVEEKSNILLKRISSLEQQTFERIQDLRKELMLCYKEYDQGRTL